MTFVGNLCAKRTLSFVAFLYILIQIDLYSQPVQYHPFIETFKAENRVRSGIAIGGLGTGSLELRKNGQFYNWTLFNNWPLGTGEPLTEKTFPRTSSEDSYLFFLVRFQVEGEKPRLKLLQLNNSLSEGAIQGIDYYYPWMSVVEKIEYTARFPFTQMIFSDSDMPFDISLEVFSPFIPHDTKNSSLPGAYFNFTVLSKTEKKVTVFLIATLRNLVGYDVLDKYFLSTEYAGEGYKGFSMSCGGMDTLRSSWGKMGIFSMSGESTYYLGWEHRHPYYEKLIVSDRFADLNDTENRNRLSLGAKRANISENKDQRCFSSVGVTKSLLPGQSFSHAFILSWFFPNSYGAIEGDPTVDISTRDYNLNLKITRNQGHYYNNFFRSDFDVANYLMENKKWLTERTLKFLGDFYNSSLPQFVLDQVNSHFNTFITSSTFTRNGSFAIREGMTPEKPWGPNATIDVSLYGSSSIIALFPDLQKETMRAHKKHQTQRGEINHGLGMDCDSAQFGAHMVYHRLDLVPDYIQMVLRDFFWTDDTVYLHEMWPSVLKGIEYILRDRDADKDSMPEMAGIMCSYDNFPMYGLASYIQSQWLAAMASVEKAAPFVRDYKTLELAGTIKRKGMALMQDKLWTGKYYGLSNDYQGDKGMDDGILTDQLIGQWVAHQSNLGTIQEEEKVKAALITIMESSYTPAFGLRNCTWPEYPDHYPIHETNLWVDQANTCWSGVELAFAALLIYEGLVDQGQAVIQTVDDRYRKSGLYWDHQEFGGHYYRPMSAWSILHAYLGLGISCGCYSFNPHLEQENYRLFFSHGNGTAHYVRRDNSVIIEVKSGIMAVNALELRNSGLTSENPEISVDGKKLRNVKLVCSNGSCRIDFGKDLQLNEGTILEIR